MLFNNKQTRSEEMGERTTDSCVFIIFGGTGDLSQRKLIPALGRLQRHGHLCNGFHVLGVARGRNHTDASFRDMALNAMVTSGLQKDQLGDFCLDRFHYQSIGNGLADDYSALRDRIEGIEEAFKLPGNRIFNLALPPEAVPAIVAGLGQAGLAESGGWTRIVIEKPFGRDLNSAEALNKAIRKQFAEDQIYRIDHYLGKETVQNLLAFRFANSVFESQWNRDHIDAVYITVAEDLGVGTRAGYYDRSGAVRDMMQNHLCQLLTLIAMEAPYAFEADAIRQEKIKVLRSISPIYPQDVVYGQYTGGSGPEGMVPGYLEETGVLPESKTETFAAVRLDFDNWRWQGVPFYLRTGKRLARKLTQIAIRFKSAPICMFQSEGACLVTSDVLLITLQPDEGFSLHIDVKKPGTQFELDRIPLSFKYSDRFGDMPEAYETLLLDVLVGDQTLFVHGDEVEASWRLFNAIATGDREIHPYPVGSWGPKQAAHLSPPETGS
jgi:glucose-6-phosphate 1-dehydrogenase